jgi:hypothetical protein
VVTSSDPSIVEVRSASLSVLKMQQTAAALVVVGKAAGSAHVHVQTDDGDRDIEVKVIPPPSTPGTTDRPAQLPATPHQIAITGS